tara:strand:+ start:8338 stop:8727 length:390 start_codon:yes stop_codon:yes gene_type:complete
MKGTIKAVQKTGTFQELQKYNVTFNHSQGDSVLFFSKSEPTDENFPLKVGTEINYELKPNGNGKIIREDNFTKAFNQMPSGKINTNDSILAQVCYKANMDAFGKDYNDKVEQQTIKDFKWMKNLIINGQ